MTYRAKIANVRSIMEQAQSKGERRDAKESQAMVPVARPPKKQLRAASNSVGLEESQKLELAKMEEARLFTDRELERLGIVHPRLKTHAMVDSIRQVRTKLFALNPTENFTVMVCSIVPRGGSSFVATNLAAAIAFDEAKSSLLMEASFNGQLVPKLLKLIGREHALGVADYLENPSVGVENIVSPSGIPRMRCVPMGQPPDGSSDYFTSARYQLMLKDIKSRYKNRYIVVDGPALEGSIDARTLSDLCDFTVLVVPYGKVKSKMLDTLVDEIDEHRLAGIVMNKRPGG